MANKASCILLLGISLPLLQAQEGEGPEIRLEAALQAMEIRGDLLGAKGVFCELATDKNVPPRLGAEALWYLAEAYRRQGGEPAAISILQYIGKKFPSTPPFTNAAATASADFSQDHGDYQEIPDAADTVAAEALSRILRSALLLGDAPEATATASQLLQLYKCINFELTLPLKDETQRELRQRRTAQSAYQEYTLQTHEILEKLKSNPPKALATAATLQILDEMSELDEEDPDNFRIALFKKRNQLTDALATGDAAKISAAAEQLQSNYAPMLEAPPKLAWSIYVKGECAAAEKISQRAAANDFVGALRIHRQSVAVLHGSGVMGAGLALRDGNLVPEPLRIRLLGSLMFLEMAIYSMSNEDSPQVVTRDLRKAQEKIESLKADPAAAALVPRLDATLDKLKQALIQYQKDEIEAAIALLTDELYGT